MMKVAVITERFKPTDQMKWVGLMSVVKAQVEEIMIEKYAWCACGEIGLCLADHNLRMPVPSFMLIFYPLCTKIIENCEIHKIYESRNYLITSTQERRATWQIFAHMLSSNKKVL